MHLYFICVQVIGKLVIPIGASCFKNICLKCHLLFLTSKDGKFYYYKCKSMITLESQAQISYKIKHGGDDEYDCVFCEP
jgi:hypothetical protein